MPWSHKAFSPIGQRQPVVNDQSDSHFSGAKSAIEASLAQDHVDSKIGPLPMYGEARSSSSDVETPLTLPYGEIGSLAEPVAQHEGWPVEPKQLGTSSLHAASFKATTPGYGGGSLPAAASSRPSSQVFSSQPSLARAAIDRPTSGSQASPSSAVESATSGGSPEEGAQTLKLDEIAHEVYAILKRRLALERERSWGIG